MTEGFAMVPNWIVRDPGTTIYEIAVYVALATHSGKGGIHPSQQTISTEAKCSERQVRTALAGLEKLGAIERVRRVNSSGRAANGYVLHVNGELADDEELVTAHGAGTDSVTAHGAGGSGTQALSVPLIEEEPYKKNPGERFDEFWAVYPSHMAKADARKKFESLVKKGVDPAVMIRGARRFRDDPNLPPLRFVPYPSTWLNQSRWEDEALPPREDQVLAVQAGYRDAESARLQDEQEREAWNDLQEWLAHYGVTLELWQEHHLEPGWVYSVEAPVREAEYVERHRMLQKMGLVRGEQ